MNKKDNTSEEQLRYRAESQIKETKDKATTQASPADLHRIVHELEVHQIELEMQNEELQIVRSNLESSLNQYTDLYDFAPVGYFTLDSKGVILKANLTGSTLIGLERSALINRPFGFFVSPEYRSVLNSFLKTVFEGHSRGSCELSILKEDKQFLFVHIEALAVDPIPQCRIAVVDTTEHILIDRKLRESEQLLHSLFETMTQGIVFLDATHKIISINPAAAHILRLSIDQIQETKWPIQEWRVIREDGSEFPREEQPSQVAFRAGTLIKNVVMGILSPKITGCIWIRVNAIPQHSFRKINPCQVILIIEDITDFKRMASYNMLTKREKEVFLLLAKNLSRQIIANILGIKAKTVDKHRENLMEKLSIYDIEGIVKFAKLIGVIKS